MQKDFDKWNTKKKEVDNLNAEVFFNEGEIWWCSMGLNVGVEIDGKNENFERPVLIYKKINNKSFICVPITSKLKNEKYYIHLKIKNKDTTLCFNQIKTLSSRRLIRRIAKISKNKLNLIDEEFVDMIKNRNPLAGESRVPIGNNNIIINKSNN